MFNASISSTGVPMAEWNWTECDDPAVCKRSRERKNRSVSVVTSNVSPFEVLPAKKQSL
jgi:hypothetical protein